MEMSILRKGVSLFLSKIFDFGKIAERDRFSSSRYEFGPPFPYSPTKIVNPFNQVGFFSVSFYDWDGKRLRNSSKRMAEVAKK